MCRVVYTSRYGRRVTWRRYEEKCLWNKEQTLSGREIALSVRVERRARGSVSRASIMHFTAYAFDLVVFVKFSRDFKAGVNYATLFFFGFRFYFRARSISFVRRQVDMKCCECNEQMKIKPNVLRTALLPGWDISGGNVVFTKKKP